MNFSVFLQIIKYNSAADWWCEAKPHFWIVRVGIGLDSQSASHKHVTHPPFTGCHFFFFYSRHLSFVHRVVADYPKLCSVCVNHQRRFVISTDFLFRLIQVLLLRYFDPTSVINYCNFIRLSSSFVLSIVHLDSNYFPT